MSDFSIEPPIRDLLDRRQTVLLRDGVFVAPPVTHRDVWRIAMLASLAVYAGGLVIAVAVMAAVVVWSLP